MKRLLSECGAKPNRIRGQNFLIDSSLMDFIMQSAQLDEHDVVLEPGAGAGNLTALLSPLCGRVIAVEIDDNLYAIAGKRLAPFQNVRLVHSDILQRGERISRYVAAAIEEELARDPQARLKVVANLPYIVSTAFTTAILLHGPVPERMIVMLQKEVADRMTAEPGGKEYGYLSVMVQAVARAHTLRRVPPGAFWPPPEVDSAIVEIIPDATLRECAGDLERLSNVASALFRHRRKQLGRILIMSEFAADAYEASDILSKIGATSKDRAETLSVDQIVRLTKAILKPPINADERR